MSPLFVCNIALVIFFTASSFIGLLIIILSSFVLNMASKPAIAITKIPTTIYFFIISLYLTLIFPFIKVSNEDDGNQRKICRQSKHWDRDVSAKFRYQLLIARYSRSIARLGRAVTKVIKEILVDRYDKTDREKR